MELDSISKFKNKTDLVDDFYIATNTPDKKIVHAKLLKILERIIDEHTFYTNNKPGDKFVTGRGIVLSLPLAC